MRNKIIQESINSLQNEGLRFSVDTLAEKLRVSKKTIYKYFPTKEALALAMYEQFYTDADLRADALLSSPGKPPYTQLLGLYCDSKKMTRSEIFNKYKLNDVIHSYASGRNDSLWEKISSVFSGPPAGDDANPLRIIIDGAFEKLCDSQVDPAPIIERLAELL